MLIGGVVQGRACPSLKGKFIPIWLFLGALASIPNIVGYFTMPPSYVLLHFLAVGFGAEVTARLSKSN
jgi:hypothetical protein